VSRPDRPDDKKNSNDQAADEGTLVHAKMEKLAEVPTDQWDATIEADPDLSPDLRQVVKDCATQVRDLFMYGLPVVTKRSLGLAADAHYELMQAPDREIQDGIYCECGVTSGITAPGTADIVLRQGNRGIVVDYKTNRVLRAHDRQQQLYVIGVFNASPLVMTVESRIVSPRLGVDAHPPVTYTREMLPALLEELEGLVALAADPFEPGCPGAQCVFCAGNGRCPWQASCLRDIPADAAALVEPAAWQAVLKPETPDVRGQRRALAKWLEGFVDAIKEDDKQWAIDNPDILLPGWTKTVGLGRASLDDTRLAEINQALALTFGLTYDTLIAFLKPDKAKLTEFLALMRGLTEDAAKKEVSKVLSPFEKRGAPIISFRAEKKGKKAEPRKISDNPAGTYPWMTPGK